MDNPSNITVVGSVIAAVILAIFGIIAGNVQKKQSDADKAELLSANKVLSDSVNQKNEELKRKSDDHSRNLEVYAKKLEIYANRLDQYATEQKVKDKEVIMLQEQLRDSAIAQKQKTEEINKISQKLIEAQEKTIGFTSESLNFLTGGDSFAYVTLQQAPTQQTPGNELIVKLYHVGKYPLSAVRVNITRVSAITRISKGEGLLYKGHFQSGVYTTVIPVGPLPKSPVPYEIGKVPYDPSESEEYSILFTAQNGNWTQRYEITNVREHNYYKRSFTVNRDGKQILEQ